MMPFQTAFSVLTKEKAGKTIAAVAENRVEASGADSWTGTARTTVSVSDAGNAEANAA